jgi:hypothetical protein
MGLWGLQRHAGHLQGVTFDHGIDATESNTGIAGAGLTAGDMATYEDATTITVPNITLFRQRFSEPITIDANNVTIRECLSDGGDGEGIALTTGALIRINAGIDGTVIEDTTLIGAHPGEESESSCILNEGSNTTISRVNASGACNLIREAGGPNVTIQYSYVGPPFENDGGVSHRDVIEIFGTTNMRVYRCRLEMDPEETAVFNLAPFSAGDAENVSLEECHLDGGNAHIIVDNQGTGEITNTRIMGNTMGGHSNPGVTGEYVALNNADTRSVVTTEGQLASDPTAILWQDNHWQETQRVDAELGYLALDPDQDGDLIDLGEGPPLPVDSIVQQNFGEEPGGTENFTVSLPAPSNAANRVVVVICGNTTVATPTGFTSRDPQVVSMGHYIMDRQGDGNDDWAFTTGAAGHLSWWVGEIEGGVFDTADGQNTTGGASYTTTEITPAAGEKILIASIGGTHTATNDITFAGWDNEFNEQAELSTLVGAERVAQGVAAGEVTANGSTGYSTGADYVGTNTPAARSAMIAAYTHT